MASFGSFDASASDELAGQELPGLWIQIMFVEWVGFLEFVFFICVHFIVCCFKLDGLLLPWLLLVLRKQLQSKINRTG